MRLKYFLIVFIALAIPGLLPAPDLPDDDSFRLLEKIRLETINKDRAENQQKYGRIKAALAKYESNNNWKMYNRFGCIGKYQFGRSALDATGYSNRSWRKFKANPATFSEQDQEDAMDILLSINESDMKPMIDKYVGIKMLNSITITRMGILAAAHLAGPANVKEFLESYGSVNARDRMGTRVSDYLDRFAM